MDNGHVYTHPLSGVQHTSSGARVVPVEGTTSRDRSLAYAVWVLAFLLGVAVLGGCSIGLRLWSAAGAAKETLNAATRTIEYEPLSKVNDGSYEEEAGGGRAKSLGVLRRLRDRK